MWLRRNPSGDKSNKRLLGKRWVWLNIMRRIPVNTFLQNGKPFWLKAQAILAQAILAHGYGSRAREPLFLQVCMSFLSVVNRMNDRTDWMDVADGGSKVCNRVNDDRVLEIAVLFLSYT